MARSRADRTVYEEKDPVARLFMLPIPPLAAGFMAWWMEEHARASLGGWRFVFVVPLAAYAVWMGLTSVLVGLIVWSGKPDGFARRRWARRLVRSLPALVVGALVYAVVQLVYRWHHDGAGTALEHFPWISLVIFPLAFPDWRRMRRRLKWSADVPSVQAYDSDGGQGGADREGDE